ncbi:MAG: hypothetical protein H6737_16725 [Alphaproteobacteria bacterium]|nr:hypothetical protein [Alphaproteobacteria bacterium]
MVAWLALVGCNEFRLDPIDPDGPPPVQVAVEETFVQAPNPAVDVLFVIDATPSMTQELAALGNDVGVLITTLEDAELDWQIGVVGASASNAHPGWLLGAPYVLTATEDDPVQRFAERLPAPGTLGEAGLQSAVLALEQAAPDGANAGFRRAGAVLQVVFVSDADDHSDAWLADPVEDFLAALEHESDAGQPVRASALVGDVPIGCVSATGTAQPGVRYAEVAQRSGGRTASICDIDFAALLGDLGEDSVSLPTRFDLRDTPVPRTLTVEVDGVESADWVLDTTGPAVVFGEPPPAGSLVTVRYVAREEAEP